MTTRLTARCARSLAREPPDSKENAGIGRYPVEGARGTSRSGARRLSQTWCAGLNTGISIKRGQPGFTLVEIAIVIVILGLLVGGVLKGREMITKSRITRIENDCASTSAAIKAYRDRYGVLPGDDPAASARFAGEWRASDNGNGDGTITGGWDSTRNGHESRKVWKHLRGAGLIAGAVDNSDRSYQQPRNSFGGVTGIDLDLYNISGISIVFSAIPGDIAEFLESRGDDGIPSRGSIQAHAWQSNYESESVYAVAFEL